MEHLEQIFTALQMADLKIKISKCEFFKKHVSYCYRNWERLKCNGVLNYK